MAEGLIGGVLGGEDDKREIEAPEALAGAEAFAAAVAAKLAGHDPEVARDTSAFLKEQTQLLQVQKEHLKDEHALRLAHLKHQSHLLRGQRVGQTIRIAFQVVTALIVIVIGVGIAVLLRDAFTSHSVVIDAFEAPAALAARGVTGTAVASGVLDELTRLQNATLTPYPALKRSVASAWSNQLKVNVPETGISLEEISRLLKARFGRDLHIGGELVQSASGALALTVRGDNIESSTFTGNAEELGKLMVAAAEHVYAESQPTLWSLYLAETDRPQEAIDFIKLVYPSTLPEYRPSLLLTWATSLQHLGGYDDESVRSAQRMYQAAHQLKPDYWTAYGNEQSTLLSLGDEEGAWRAGEAMRRVAGQQGATGDMPFRIASANWDQLTWNLQAMLSAIIANAEATGGRGTNFIDASVRIAEVESRLHDPTAAELTLQTSNVTGNGPLNAARNHFARGLVAAETGDVARAATEMEAYDAALGSSLSVGSSAYRRFQCEIAPFEEAAGHPDRADAVLSGGEHFVNCLRFRGDILDGRGDWSGAQKAYTQAVALAPDLPAGYYSWGVALAHHGDLAGSEGKLKDANQRGPRWADPLKAWGDVLVKQGKTGDALGKYDEALKYAPNWAALKEAREAVVKRKS